MMEATWSFEMPVGFQWTTGHCITEVLFSDELDDGPCDALLPGEEGEIRHIWQSLPSKQALSKLFLLDRSTILLFYQIECLDVNVVIFPIHFKLLMLGIFSVLNLYILTCLLISCIEILMGYMPVQ